MSSLVRGPKGRERVNRWWQLLACIVAMMAIAKLYTAKGTASIFAGWGAARLVEAAGSWIPVFWVAVGCDLLAAILALFVLKPLVIKLTTSPVIQPGVAGAPARATVATRG
jgi:hypothetical protein